MSEEQFPLAHLLTHPSIGQANYLPAPLAQSPDLHLRHSAFLASAAAPQSSAPLVENREPVQLMVIGSAQGIETIVQTLHLRGFAHIGEWSIVMPHSSGKLMRVLTRWVQQQL